MAVQGLVCLGLGVVLGCRAKCSALGVGMFGVFRVWRSGQNFCSSPVKPSIAFLFHEPFI